MKKNKYLIPAWVMIFAVATLFAFTSNEIEQEPWEVPGKYKKMENPAPDDKESMAIGRSLWRKHCASCHGKGGEGDGSKSAELETDAGDFTSAGFQDQSDGVIYYKTTFGRDEMPAYDKKIPSDEDRWILVHYMRSFAK